MFTPQRRLDKTVQLRTVFYPHPPRGVFPPLKDQDTPLDVPLDAPLLAGCIVHALKFKACTSSMDECWSRVMSVLDSGLLQL